MAEQKSKLPDLNEVTSMASKLFKDVKTSISQIIEEYKLKHATPPEPTIVTPPEPPKSAVPPIDPKIPEAPIMPVDQDMKPKVTKTKEPISKDKEIK